MRRIVIVGAGGSGKSTLARRLGEILGLPVIHLDQLAFRPGWVSVPKDEWRAQQESIVQGESWIIDGNRESTMPIRLGAWLRLISEHARTAQLITLRRPRETQRFLASLPRHSPSEER